MATSQAGAGEVTKITAPSPPPPTPAKPTEMQAGEVVMLSAVEDESIWVVW